MRRLLRWLTNLVCVVCLLLGLACLIAWPVSYWREVEVNYERIYSVPESTEWGHIYRGYSTGGAAARGRLRFGYVDTGDATHKHIRDQIASFEVVSNFHWNIIASEDLGGQPPWFRISQGNPSLPITEVRIVLPLPFIAALLVIPILLRQAFFFLKRLRRRHRLQSGLCLYCGYNLHGITSDTCPECGQARAMVTVQSD